MTNNALVTIYSMKDGTQITSKLYEESVVETEIFAGKNQPYSGVIVKLVKNTFSDAVDGGIWNDTNKRPTIVNGETKIDVATFGTINKYIIANVSTDSSYTTIVAYHPAYRLAYTRLSEVFNKMFKVKFVDVYDFPNIPTTDEYKVQPKWGIFSTGLHDFTSKHSSIKDSNNISRTVSIGDAVIPSDAYRASKNKGAQKIYTGNIGSNLNIFDSEYKTDPLFDISKYTSGIGYEGETGTIDSDNPALNKFTFWHRKDGINLIFHINVVDVSKYNESGVLIEPQKYTSEIEWVEGRSEDIIRFLLKYAMDDVPTLQYFTTPSMFYPDPTTYESDSTADISDSYTNEALQAAVQRGPIIIDPYDRINALPNLGTPIGVGINTERIRLRVGVDVPCGSIIQNLATLTNRYFFFCDEGFFLVGTEEVAISTSGDVTTKDKRKVTVYTEHSSSASFLTPRAGVLLDMDPAYSESILGNIVTPEELIMTPNLQDNGDGNVIGSQTVEGDGYSVKIYNSSSESSNAGVNILLPVADMGEGNNAYRNRILEICAYNALVKNYKFEDNITYNVSELLPYIANYNTKALGDEPNKKYFTNLSDLNSYKGTVVPGNNDIAMVDSGIIEQAYKYEGGEWNPIDSSNPALTINTMVPVIPLHTVAKELRDNFNGVILHNAPLNLITRSYPYFDTTLQWGNSATCDLVAQTKELKVSSVTNSNSGSEDAKISNKFASKLVVGNLTLDELTKNNDEKSGYTGLIMEKHVGSDLYRLSGYNKGAVQAEFDTKGRISAGGGSIILDEHGLTMGEGDSSITVGEGGFHAGPVTLDNTGVYVNDSSTPPKKLVWMNEYGFAAGDVYMDNTGVFVSEKVFMNINGFSSADNGMLINQEGMTVGAEVVTDGEGNVLTGGHIKLGLKGIEIGEPFKVGGKERVDVLIDNTGIKVGPYTNTNNVPLGTVYMDRDGVYVRDITGASPYDKVRMNSSGFHVGKSGSTVTMDENGVHAGAVLMDFKGMRIKNEGELDYIDINQNGFFVGPDTPPVGEVVKSGQVSLTSAGVKAGKVTLNSTGLLVDDVDGKVTITKDGLKAGDGSVHLHKTGLTVGNVANRVTLTMDGVKAGKVTLNSTGLLVDDEVGKVTITKDGLNAGKVTLNNAGLLVDDVNGKITITKDGLNAGKVTLNNAGLLVDDVNGKITITKDGLNAGKVTLNNAGLLVDDVNGKITITKDGLNAGKVTLNNAGVNVNSKVYLNANGIEVAGHVLMNETGFIVGVGTGKVTMDGTGVKAGSVHLHSTGLTVGSGANLVTMTDQGVKAGKVTLNNAGLLVDDVNGKITITKDGLKAGTVTLNNAGVNVNSKVYLNANGIEVAGHVLMNETGFTVGVGTGKVTMDSTGVKAGNSSVHLHSTGLTVGSGANLVTMTDQGVKAGTVTLNNAGVNVNSKVYLNANGIEVAGHVLMNETGFTVGVGTGKVTMDSTGVKAGNSSVHLHSTGLTVGSGANLVTMTDQGVKAGKVTLNNAGVNVNSKVYMNANGIEVAGHVLMNETGFIVGTGVGKVTMDSAGVKAGSVHLHSTGLNVGSGANLVTMTDQGVKAGTVTLNNAGVNVNSKVYLNANGIEVAGHVLMNETGFTVGVGTGKVTMNSTGVHAGDVTLNSSGLQAGNVTIGTLGITIGDATNLVTMGAGGITAGDVIIDGSGVYVANKVYMNGDGFTVGTGPGKVTMNGSGVHAGDVTLNSLGVQAGDVKLNSTGLEVTGEVFINESGFYSHGEKITINNGGLQVGAHVKMDEDGVEAGGGFVKMNQQGFFVGNADNLVKMDSGGITAGNVYITKSGINVNNKVLINQSGVGVAGHVLMNETGFTVGAGPGEVTMNGTGVHAGSVHLHSTGLTVGSGANLVTMTDQGVKAGTVTLNNAGVNVNSKVYLNANGIEVAGHVLMNETGFTVGVGTGKVTMDSTGVKAGNSSVHLHSTGLTVGSGANLVTMTDQGVKAGKVTLNNAGVNVNSKVYMNANGIEVAGHVLMNETGFIVGTGVGKVTMDSAGVKAGTTLLNSNGFYVLKNTTDGVTVANTHVSMGAGGVKAGPVSLNNAGVNVNSKVYLNANGIEVAGHVLMNETGFTVGVGTGKVTMDSTGVSAGATLLDANGFHIVSNTGTGFAKEHVLMNSNGLIIGPSSATAGKVTVNKDGLTAGSVNVNNAGVYVANKVYMNGDGFIVGSNATTGAQVKMTGAGVSAGTVILNKDGINVDGGKVTMGTGGVKAGNTVLDSNGFHIVSNTGTGFAKEHVLMNSNGLIIGPSSATAGKVTVNKDGLTAGSVKVNDAGIYVADKVYMNGDGFIVGSNATTGAQVKMTGAGVSAGTVILNKDGINVDGGKVTMGTGGVKAGNTVLDSNGFHVIANASKAPTVAGNTLVTMKSTGVHAGSVTLNNNGLQVADGTTLKTVMNSHGFIVGPTGGLPTATTGKVLMDENGLSAGPGEGTVALDGQGLTIYSEKALINTLTNEYNNSQSIKFRDIKGASIDDLGRIYVSKEYDINYLNITAPPTSDYKRSEIRLHNRRLFKDSEVAPVHLYEVGGRSTNAALENALKVTHPSFNPTPTTSETVYTITFNPPNTLVYGVGDYTCLYMSVNLDNVILTVTVADGDRSQTFDKNVLLQEIFIPLMNSSSSYFTISIKKRNANYTASVNIMNIYLIKHDPGGVSLDLYNKAAWLEGEFVATGRIRSLDGLHVDHYISAENNSITIGTGIPEETFLRGKFIPDNDVLDSLGLSTLRFLNRVYPLGSIYMNAVYANPGAFLGGTWEAYGQGKVLVGVDVNDSDFKYTGNTGGAKTHTLTTAQMPSHTHTAGTTELRGTFAGGRGAAATGVFADGGNDDTQDGSKYPQKKIKMDADHTHTVSSAGSGSAHNNLQPYITVYMFKRIA